MDFRPLDDTYTTPSEELRHFTNRVSEQEAFQKQLNVSTTDTLPVLMFYGVGGTGKTWLLKKLREDLGRAIPTAYLNLDPKSGGEKYHTDSGFALAEIRRQFGKAVFCPRFDLAYAWLRCKQGQGNDPLFKGTGLLGNMWEFVVEATNALTGDLPGGNLITWLGEKLTSPVRAWLKDSSLADWFASQLGEEDFLRLKSCLPDDIYIQLHERLLRDLQENLPERDERLCRGVVFVDAVETLRSARDSWERQHDVQHWLRDLYHPQSGVLLVAAGRDHLSWGHPPGSPFANPKHLEQHLVGGLSRPDAEEFLGRCGVKDEALREAILRVSEDVETRVKASSESYHAFSLGLCADTVWTTRRAGAPVDSKSFDMTPGDREELARRFLRSLGSDESFAIWLKKLAVTIRFDERAVRSAFGSENSLQQDAAWNLLKSYSFVRATEHEDWKTLHLRMRESLWSLQDTQSLERNHKYWHSYWLSRVESESDDFGFLAWYHQWQLDREAGLRTWKNLTNELRTSLRMDDHLRLLSWWQSTGILDQEIRVNEAAALSSLGVEYWRASLGNRKENLLWSIDCHQAALKVYTKSKFPVEWAMSQNNLGLSYTELPPGESEENFKLAVRCYKFALEVFSETKYPKRWAATQNNLANVFRKFQTGDDDKYLKLAINCYESALRVYTEADSPQLWGVTVNNLGNAYRQLRTGDVDNYIKRAIECYKSALRVRNETDLPQEWAMTQNNLANAYGRLGLDGDPENLHSAIECYQAALKIYKETTFPREWAKTQSNLGATYFQLRFEDSGPNLVRAIECYQAALRVYTKSDYTHAWAITRENLKRAKAELKKTLK